MVMSKLHDSVSAGSGNSEKTYYHNEGIAKNKTDKYIELPYKNVFDHSDWKDGNSVILYDGCFSTLQVTEKNKLKIKKLVNFPDGDCIFYTFPEVNVIYGYSGGVTQLFYDLDTKRTLLLEPIFTRRYWARGAMLLDSERKLFLLIYGDMLTQEKYDYLIYDLPNNKILSNPFEQESDFRKDVLEYRLGDYLFLCKERDKLNPRKITNNYYIYDFNKKERIDNELTAFLSLLKYGFGIAHLSLEEKTMIISAHTGGEEKNLFISWEDDYKNIKATPFFSPAFNNKKTDYEIPGTYFNKWVVFDSYSTGLNGEILHTIGFSKTDSPVHVPVVIDEYFENRPPYLFLEHPIYGPCCFMVIEKNGKKTIRMYKMSDVQSQIDLILNTSNEICIPAK